MNDEGSISPATERSLVPSSRSRVVLRVFVQGMLASFLLGTICASLPPTWKRLGLIYALQGGLFGAAFAWIVCKEGITRPQRFLAMLAMQTTLSLLNTSLISARQYRTTVEARYAQQPEIQTILNVLRKNAPTNPEAASQLRELERQVSPPFEGYLRFRYSNVVKSGRRVPEVLWGGEVLLGVLSAIAVCSSVSRRLRNGNFGTRVGAEELQPALTTERPA